ncbi:MAG: DNA alkylation repair protein [Tissierellia bacterium]|nr:DNA alkylation repair protein [Tissierellia bacterium]
MDKYIESKLMRLRDESYKEFNSKLIPNINPDKMIGIRIPVLRKLAKEIYREYPDLFENFLRDIPHFYFEEDNLHALMIDQIRDFNIALEKTEAFLPYIDNWQTCDIFSPKIFKEHKKIVLEKIEEWLKSDQIYTVRFAIGLLLSNYLKNGFKEEYFDMICDIDSDEYYIKMMIAWYFSMALVYQYDAALKIIKEYKLKKWIHNKTIQKAIESRRISKDKKEFLKTLKL